MRCMWDTTHFRQGKASVWVIFCHPTMESALMVTRHYELTKSRSVKTRPPVKVVLHKICVLHHKAKRALCRHCE